MKDAIQEALACDVLDVQSLLQFLDRMIDVEGEFLKLNPYPDYLDLPRGSERYEKYVELRDRRSDLTTAELFHARLKFICIHAQFGDAEWPKVVIRNLN